MVPIRGLGLRWLETDLAVDEADFSAQKGSKFSLLTGTGADAMEMTEADDICSFWWMKNGVREAEGPGVFEHVELEP